MNPPPNLDCLDAETLAAYLDGLLAADAIGRADRHIDHCRACRSELSALAATQTFPAGSGDSYVAIDGTPIESRLGRYEVLREIGRGSMGVVVRAYDPELARAVAVKILSPRLWDGSDARDRLRREAQAMARLTHPNVVTVYDVATHDDSLCIAMELVEGETLRDWVTAPRPWRETLRVCILAGRGLAAAHAAKLVHRDYKPENVLLAADGRVAISDLGLARDARDATPTLAGSPAYMAPEVFRGEPATAASDQFSFCVATYEALYGERPFGGETLAELRDHIIGGVLRDPTGGAPPWVRTVLLRGMSSDADARFGSMPELLERLEAGVPSRKRYVVAAALGVAAIGALVMWRAGSDPVACAITDSGAWTEPRRQELERALAGKPQQDIARITGAFAAHSESWLATRRSSCEAGRRGEPQRERIACLERGRRELDELVTLVTRDPALATRAVEAVGKLRDPASCRTANEAEHPEQAAIDRATALVAAGKSQEAIAVANGIIARTRDSPRALAEAFLVRGRAENQLGQLEASEATLSDALTAAESARADQLVAAIWVEIVQTSGAQKHRFEAAQANVRAADAAFTRVETGPALRARYAYVVGAMYLAKGKLAQARVHLDRALVAQRGAGERGLVHSALCDVHRQERHFDAARTHCQTAVAQLSEGFGPDHPRLGHTFNVWGALDLDQGDLDAARANFERAVSMFETTGLLGERALGLALSNAAVVHMRRGDLEHARPLFERARTLFATYHPDHPQRVLPLQGLASLALETDDFYTAIGFYEEALAVIESVYGMDAEARQVVLYNLALAYQRLGDPAKANALTDELIAQAQHPGRERWSMVANALDLQAAVADDANDVTRSVALRERALAALDKDDRPASRAWIESQLGDALRRLARFDQAIPHLERAVAYYGRDRTDRYTSAIARFSLARALWASDRRRALEVGRAARDDFATATSGLRLAGLRQEVGRWLLSRTNRIPHRRSDSR
jgi:tetratricopeptide (TPR) repeat protein